MSYRVFRRAWWADEACTKPVESLSRGTTIATVETVEEARAMCRAYNWDDATDARIQRPFGVAYEYEEL
jgi:hypothetical protein